MITKELDVVTRGLPMGIEDVVLGNKRIREVFEGVGISRGSREAIFGDILILKRAANKLISKSSNFYQK